VTRYFWIASRHCARSKRGIETTVAQSRQHGVGFLLHQQQFEPRESGTHRGQDVRQQVRRQRREQAESHGAGFRILAASRQFTHLRDFGDDLARAFGDLAADRRQHHPPRCAFHQRHAKLILQLADLRGQRRLADEARRRRATEVLVIGEGDQISEVTQVHRVALDGHKDWLSTS